MKKGLKINALIAVLLMCIGLFAFGAHAATNTPAQVKNLKAEVTESQVTLRWTAIKGVSGYSIWQSKAGGAFAKVGAVKGNAAVLKKLVNGTEYKYYVCAYKTVGTKTYRGKQSNTVKAVPKPVNPGAVTAKLYSNGNQKITLSWNKVKLASGYEVWQKNAKGKYSKVGTTTKLATTIKNLKNNTVYTFRIRAFRKIGNSVTYGPLTAEILARPTVPSKEMLDVHRVYYWGTANSTFTATSTDGKTKTKFKAGQKILVINKSGGYSYLRYNGVVYKVSASLMTNRSMITDSRKAYSPKTATEYVNYKGFTSTSNYFIWVNTYTQHVYVFKGSQYRWVLQKHFMCSTGKIDAQTSIGFTYIRSKQAEWWFAYDQVAYYASRIGCGAFHSWLYYPNGGKYPGIGVLGQPASHGCIRVEKNNAKYIYQTIPPNGRDGRRTTVFVW